MHPQKRKNSKSNMFVIVLMASTIIHNTWMCEASSLNRAGPIDYNLRRPIGSVSKPARSRTIRSPPSAPVAINGNAAPRTGAESPMQSVTEPAGLIQEEPTFDDDISSEVISAGLADLHDTNRTMATVKVSHPSRLLSVLQRLANDVAWSMFEESYRLRGKGQVSEEFMSKIREMIERDGPPLSNLG